MLWRTTTCGFDWSSQIAILHKVFYRVELAGMHEAIVPAPASFASELQGLFRRKALHVGKHY
eukprot:1158902-Pelagomonas_calceolata.AAC.10